MSYIPEQLLLMAYPRAKGLRKLRQVSEIMMDSLMYVDT